MADYIDTLFEKKIGAKIKRAGFVWKKTSEDTWVCLSDPDKEPWSEEELAEHFEELDLENKELNFDD